MGKLQFCVVLLFLLLRQQPASAQADVSFELAACTVLDSGHSIATFGGISAIESRPDSQGLLLVNDHDKNGQSYLFLLNDSTGIEAAAQPAGLADVESFRMDARTGIIAWSFEGKKSTGLITQHPASGQQYDTLVFEKIPGPHTTDNRGIEGLAFAQDSSLWMAFESGGDTTCGSSGLAFRKYNYDPAGTRYLLHDFNAYAYPIDRCNCTATKEGKRFNGWVGNGVSEILFLPGSSDSLLVLERCYDGTTGKVALWLATIDPGKRTLTKTLAFDFNDPGKSPAVAGTVLPATTAGFITQTGSKLQTFKPDNLEGMCWGKDQQGNWLLYLVSDDNYRHGKQQTQLLTLRMKKLK